MDNNFDITNIIKDNFITGYRAYDVCRNIDKVYTIRSINNSKYDINIPNINPILYNEQNGGFNQKIPYIYGSIHSSINFGSILENKTEFSICILSKYNGNNKYNILTINNKNNITAIGHTDNWSGIVYYKNSTEYMYKSSKNNLGNIWTATCISYNANSTSTTIVGNNLYVYDTYKNHSNLKNINGILNINDNNNININSDWALSHLLIWDKALDSNKLEIVYKSLISYIYNPILNDIILYNNYPRELAPNNCIKPIETFNTQTSSLNISKSLWAGYYAGDYDTNLNVLPNFAGNKSRDLTSNMLMDINFSTDLNIPFLSGTKNAGKIIFPQNSLNSNFTLCSITKYTSKNPESNNMILQTQDNNSSNLFTHGHYNNKNGVIIYNTFEISKGYISSNAIDTWTVVCAKNTNSTLPTENVLINGNNTGLIIPTDYLKLNKSSQTLTINHNNDSNFSSVYNSDWALSYLLIWDSHLSDIELKNVSDALNDFLKTGKKLIFNNETIPTAPTAPTIPTIPTVPTVPTVPSASSVPSVPSASNNSSLLYLFNLSPIQKQLLGL